LSSFFGGGPAALTPGIAERRNLVAKLEAARGTKVLVYVTSTRPNLESPLAMDVLPIIYRHLATMGDAALAGGIDVLIHTNGGEGIVPWRLLQLLRSFSGRVSVLVPHLAYSGGTLMALGADEVVMHRMGTLGPIDPTVNSWFNPPHPDLPGRRLGISVEDLASFFDFIRDDVALGDGAEAVQAVAALLQQVHPLALGSVKRSTLQSRMLGKRLLIQGGMHDAGDLDAVVERLASELYSHGHPISPREARTELGLAHVTEAPDDVAVLMWRIYESFAAEMQLEDAFDVVELMSGGHPLPLPEPQQLVRQQKPLGPYPVALVESAVRADAFELLFDGVITRGWDGAVSTNLTLVKAAWTQRA